MRKIEFLDQAQETLTGFHKSERRGKKEKDSKLVRIIFLFTYSIRVQRLQVNKNN